jgi:hypothetical protein
MVEKLRCGATQVQQSGRFPAVFCANVKGSGVTA